MFVTVPSAGRGPGAGGWRSCRSYVEAETHTPARARARKSARRTTTMLHVQSCTVRARARRARSIISDQRPDALRGTVARARTRSGETANLDRKPNRSGGRRGNARASTPILAFSFTQLLAQVTSFKFRSFYPIQLTPPYRFSIAHVSRVPYGQATPGRPRVRPGPPLPGTRSRPRHCGLISAIISLKFASRTTDRDGCYTCILA